jgi:hypothetical protein
MITGGPRRRGKWNALAFNTFRPMAAASDALSRFAAGEPRHWIGASSLGALFGLGRLKRRHSPPAGKMRRGKGICFLTQ